MSLPPGPTANYPEIQSNIVAISKKPLPIFPSELQMVSIQHSMLLFTFFCFLLLLGSDFILPSAKHLPSQRLQAQ